MFPLKKKIKTVLFAGFVFVSLLWPATDWVVNPYAQADDPNAATASLPEVDKEEDEFYAHVDEVNSPTELTVTVLDVWKPVDKLLGPRWPEGRAKVKPTKRAIILEDISVPNDAEQKKAALDFINKTVKESGDEIICTGSNVSVKKESDTEIVCITGYVFVKNGSTLNNALVSEGLATTANPIYRSRQDKARQQKLGIWRDQK